MIEPITLQPGQQVQYIQQGPRTITLADAFQPRGPPRVWSTGLFGCCDDMGVCMSVVCCPQAFMCMMTSALDESCCFGMCAPNPILTMRALVRGRHNIEGDLLNDFLVTACLPCFASCQLAREVNSIKYGKAAP